jgi:predicted ATPase/DNA-binding NarL/FixJ family response regulator
VLGPSQLPVPPSRLVGRSAEVAEVRALLGSARLVTLTGPPGVGKTRLALAVVEDEADVVWVDLAPVTDVSAVVGEIGRALGLTSVTSAAQLAAATDRRHLVVLDNCEHLAGLAAVVADVLAASSRLRALATSRERLRLAAEREYAVPPLAMPGVDELDDPARLRDNPAVALLLDRAPGGVRLTPGTARPLAEICIGLDGLPLAIELAAARLRVFTPSELAFRLERRTAILTSAVVDAPERHRDLRTAINWSYELLPERERAVFRRLSVLVGAFTIADATAVTGDAETMDAVESLLDKSLVRRVADGGDEARFALLVSLREFAAERLTEAGEEAAARSRHAHWFAGRGRAWEATVGSPAETATLAELPRVRADLRAALAAAREGGPGTEPDDALWLATMLGWDGYLRGLLADAAVVLEVLDEGSPDAHPDARDAVTLSAGVVAFGLADLDRCAALLLELAAAPDPDARRPLVAGAFLGHVARGQGRYDEAAVRYHAARDAALRSGNRRGQAWADHDLALLAMEEGRDVDAEPLLREALDLFAELDYLWGTAVCARVLGAAEVRRGAVDDAARHLGQSLQLHREVGDRRGIAQCFEALAEVALARGSAATAARLVGAAARQREVAASPATDGEMRVLEDLTRRMARDLGGPAAAREQRAGRTMPAEASLELATRLTAAADAPASATLTPRQQEVAALVAEGLTNRLIGRRLGISEKTAEIHVSNLMSRLGVPSRAGVAAWAAGRAQLP